MSKRETQNTETIAKRNTVTPSNNIQWGLERAIKTGLRIVEPAPNELQLDIDSIGLLTFHEMQWSILKKAGILKGWKKKITRSKRGGEHVHITITIPYRSVTELLLSFRTKHVQDLVRVLFQVILGSDPKREAFNLCRVLKGNKYPIVFFEKERHAKTRKKTR